MYRYKCPVCGGNQYSASPCKEEERCVYCGSRGVRLMPTLDDKDDQPQEEQKNTEES